MKKQVITKKSIYRYAFYDSVFNLLNNAAMNFVSVTNIRISLAVIVICVALTVYTVSTFSSISKPFRRFWTSSRVFVVFFIQTFMKNF